MTTETTTPTYRFSLRDRTGWILGLGAAQCVALATGVVAAGAILNNGAAGPLVLLPVLLAVGFSFGQWQGQPLHQVAPVAVGWGATKLAGRDQWSAPLPRFDPTGIATVAQPFLPPSFDGIIIDSCDMSWTRRGRNEAAAIIRDRVDKTATAVLRVSGREFALSEHSEQRRLLAMWGDALGAFCAERGPVSRIRWTEWAAPAGLDDQLAYLDRHRRAPDTASAVVAYRELLESAGPMSTRHEVLVAVTVAERKARRRVGDTAATLDETLIEEVRLLTSRLENAGLGVSLPLTPSDVADVFRSRLDPYANPAATGRKRSLAELAGLVTVTNAGPLIVDASFAHLQVDHTLHAAYVIAEWPRLEVPPNWMEPLLLHAGGIRTIAVHYEPVPHSRSQRQIDRDTVKLAADEEQRHRQGFRIGARHRRAQAEVVEREAELVAGYPEYEFVGTVHISAPDRTALERSCAEYEQVAAQVGIELRRLDGQHDLALPCLLPIGRGIAGKRGLA